MRFFKMLVIVSLISIAEFGSSAFAEEISSSSADTFLRKYTLAEYFELGLESSYIKPSSARTTNMGNLYVTLSHTTQEYSTLKFKTGYLSGDFVVNNQRTGRFYFTTVGMSWIVSLKSGNIRPYYGGTLAWHFFEEFRPMRLVYSDYEAENTFSWGLLGGVKYMLPAMGVSIGADVSYDWVKAFRFYSNKLGLNQTPIVRRVDFSGFSITLNGALHF